MWVKKPYFRTKPTSNMRPKSPPPAPQPRSEFVEELERILDSRQQPQPLKIGEESGNQ